MPTDDRITRLPKWAQHEILCLQESVAREKKRADAMTGDEKTNTSIARPGRYGQGHTRYLPNNQTVIFHVVPTDASWGGAIRCRVKSGGRLDIMGDESLIVLPTASNCLTIKMGRND